MVSGYSGAIVIMCVTLNGHIGLAGSWFWLRRLSGWGQLKKPAV